MENEDCTYYLDMVKRRCLLLLSLCFFCIIHVQGQIDTTSFQVVELSSCHDKWCFITDKILVYRDRTRRITFDEVREESFQAYERKAISFYKGYDSYYWFKMAISNDLEKDTTLIITPGIFKWSRLFVYNGGGYDIKKFGYGYSKMLWENPLTPNEVSIHLPKGETRYIYMHGKRLGYGKTSPLHPRLRNSLDVKQSLRLRRGNFFHVFLFRSMFLGILLFVLLFTGLQYFQHRDKLFLVYMAYLASLIAYFLDYFERLELFNFVYSYIGFLFDTYILISYLVFITYMWFIDRFLNAKYHQPVMHKFICWTMIALSAIFLIHALLFVLDLAPLFQIDGYFLVRYIMFAPFLIIQYYIYRHFKRRDSQLILWGSMCLLIFSFISLWLSLNTKMNNTIFVTQIGILLEVLFFSSALAYRRKLISQEKVIAQNELILQLEENSKLQEQLKSKLENEVAAQAEEISVQKEATIKASYEKQIQEMESQMLRSQMNPHFLFNSLNSIKHYALSKEPHETAKYVTVFSKLVRRILENSGNKTIPLAEELETIELYIDVEKKRFKNSFFHEIKVDESINAHNVFVPPMLLQPYVENAIWHGLMHKDQPGNLVISIKDGPGVIKVEIRDDGIGRAASQRIQARRQKYGKDSLGTKITKNRLDLIKEIYYIEAEVVIEDLYDSSEKPIGTLVTIDIPKLSIE